MKAKRGRPRQFNPEQVLQSALEIFWSKGFTATSLDDLSAAMGMTRPSLYNAFGDKEHIYRLAIKHFVSMMRDEVASVLFAEPTLKAALLGFYAKALNVYYEGTEPLGCFVTCTMAAEAATHLEIKKDLHQVISEIDTAFEKRLLIAIQEGEWSQARDVKQAAKLLHATLQSCALRARAGMPRKDVKKMYVSLVDLLCSVV